MQQIAEQKRLVGGARAETRSMQTKLIYPGLAPGAILFAAILIFIMVGGSFWIMFDLHHRMAV